MEMAELLLDLMDSFITVLIASGKPLFDVALFCKNSNPSTRLAFGKCKWN